MNNNLKNHFDNNIELINLKINKLENKFKTIENLLLDILKKNKNKNDNSNIIENRLNIIDNKIIKLETKINNLNNNNLNNNDLNNENIFHIDKFNITNNDIENSNNLLEIKQLLKFIVNLQDDMKDRIDLLDLEINNMRSDLKKSTILEDKFVSVLDESAF